MPREGASSAWKAWTKTLSCKAQEDKVLSPSPMLRNLSSSPASATSSSSSRTPSLSGCSRSVLKGVIHGNTKVAHKSASCSPQQESPVRLSSTDFHSGGAAKPLPRQPPPRRPPPRSSGATMRLGGCQGCHVADEAFLFRTVAGGPYASRLQRASATCPRCGTICATSEALEQHNATKHAVTEILREEYQYAVVEKIWLRKAPGSIDRILRLNSSRERKSSYREYQRQVQEREKAKQRLGRCSADGDEQMWFYAAAVTCDLGAYGSSAVCSSAFCACRLIRSGFQFLQQRKRFQGIRLAATCMRAHQCATSSSDHPHRQYAMLVCKVIAGNMHSAGAGDELPNGYDSVLAGDLHVFVPCAVLPEFAIIYTC